MSSPVLPILPPPRNWEHGRASEPQCLPLQAGMELAAHMGLTWPYVGSMGGRLAAPAHLDSAWSLYSEK